MVTTVFNLEVSGLVSAVLVLQVKSVYVIALVGTGKQVVSGPKVIVSISVLKK